MAVKGSLDLREIKVNTEWKKNVQTKHYVRGFQFVIDEPKKIGRKSINAGDSQ